MLAHRNISLITKANVIALLIYSIQSAQRPDQLFCFGHTQNKSEYVGGQARITGGGQEVAITFNENSKLAQVCDNIIHPNLKRPDIPIAGL